MNNKPSKQYLLKSVVIFVLGLVAAYTGKDLINGETLATIDNIIAGGIGATSIATLLITMLIQNYLPKSTGEQVSTHLIPIITNSNLSMEQKFDELKNVVVALATKLDEQEANRQALLNENNE